MGFSGRFGGNQIISPDIRFAFLVKSNVRIMCLRSRKWLVWVTERTQRAFLTRNGKDLATLFSKPDVSDTFRLKRLIKIIAVQ